MEDSSKSRINKLHDDKKKIEEEIHDIQSSCKHSNQTLRQENREIRWVCDDCGLKLRWPTQSEINDFIDLENSNKT
jgi:ribosomal protein L37AE/L43A